MTLRFGYMSVSFYVLQDIEIDEFICRVLEHRKTSLLEMKLDRYINKYKRPSKIRIGFVEIYIPFRLT